MSTPLQAWIESHPVIDVHEHHMPHFMQSRDVGLLTLLRQSYVNWTRPRDPTAEGWAGVSAYLHDCGSNSFVRNMVGAIGELYDLGPEGITEQNWQALDREIRLRHADPAWNDAVLDRAGIQHIIADPYEVPLLDARKAFGPRYSAVLRINALCIGWHPESKTTEVNAQSMLEGVGVRPATFDEFLGGVDRLIETMSDRHQIGLKCASAYEREVNFDDIDESLARRAFGRIDPSPAERKAFGDVVMDRCCRLAGERGIPFQVHLGSALVRGSRPMNFAGVVERHARTRFVLMHMGFPWSDDMLALAFAFPNVWLDICWAALLSPTFFKRVLHEMIESVPDESRLMFGGDNWHAEETFGAIRAARRLIGQVLQEKVDAGYFIESDARRLAGKILLSNAKELYRL